MKTFEEQQAFFEKSWDGLREAAESGGAEALLAFLDHVESPLERRVLSLFARQGLMMRDWDGPKLDVYAAFARGAIDRILAEGEAATDPERASGAKELANVISYNLAADLADCWPGDEMERKAEHFAAGLAAARDCVRWRDELDKGPGPRSMALWVQGMHELSQGEKDAATLSFEASLAEARKAAETEAEFGVVLGRGYLGLARWTGGDDAGRQAYEDAIRTFEGQLEDEERKGDARFGIDQLETVRKRYAS